MSSTMTTTTTTTTELVLTPAPSPDESAASPSPAATTADPAASATAAPLASAAAMAAAAASRGVFYGSAQAGVCYHGATQTKFHQGHLQGKSPDARSASAEVSDSLAALAESARIDPNTKAVLQDRIDWERLNSVVVAAKDAIVDTFTSFNLNDTTLGDLSRAPPGVNHDIYFQADNLPWSGNITTGTCRHHQPNQPPGRRLNQVKVSLPTDGFLVTHPSVSGVTLHSSGRDRTHMHRTHRNGPPPAWLLIHKNELAAQLPAVRELSLGHFFTQGCAGGDCFIRQAVAEQRVDIHFAVGSVGLCIKFETMLPQTGSYFAEVADGTGW